MKTVRKLGLASALVISTMVAASGAMAADRLVVAVWGGAWNDSLRKNVIEPFKAKYGVDIVVFNQRSAADTVAKLLAEKNAPGVDIWLTNPAPASKIAAEGLLEPISEQDVPELANIPDAMKQKQDGKIVWVVTGAKEIGIVYRDDLVKAPAKITMDWLASTALKGQLALPTPVWNFGAFPYQVAVASGTDGKNVAAGFPLAKRIAANTTVIYGTTGEAIRLLSTGEASIAYSTTGTAMELMKNGVKNIAFARLSDTPVFVSPEGVAVIKGSPASSKLKAQFINFMLGAEVLQRYGEDILAASTNNKSVPPTADKMAYSLTPAQMTSSMAPDLTLNLDALSESWNREITPLIGR